MKYALFLGCTIPVRGQNYEMSARKVAEALGIEFVDVPEFSCCGFPAKSVDFMTSLLMSARNMAIAEEKGLDILTLCNACTVTLVEAQEEFRKHPELLEEVNKKLTRIGKKYTGKVKVRHFARFLYEEYGVEKLKEHVKRPLENLNLAAHYGCHFIRPSEVYEEFDDPEHPVSLDRLIEATGARSVNYMEKEKCCGGGILGIKEEDALKMTKEKLDEVKKVNADAMISICPFCSIMYEGSQKKIEKLFETEYGIPVLYYPQVLGLAMGFTPEEMGFKLNRVRANKVLEKVGGDEKGRD